MKRKDRKLEKSRAEALSSITGDRMRVELMASRPRTEDDKLDTYRRNAAMAMHCPNCNSTLFHVRERPDGSQHLCCYKGQKCGWSVQINPPVPFNASKETQPAMRKDA